MKCIIIANGDIKDYAWHKQYIDEGDCIICADGGARHALSMGKTPDYLLGDFDSLDKGLLLQMENLPQPPRFVRFSTDKDKTDTHLAIELALEMQPDRIILMGATGSRWDHTLANITMLSLLPQDIPISLVNENNELFLITTEAVFEGESGEEVSFLPLSPIVRGVTTRGLKWPLVDHTIKMGDSLGVSNMILEPRAGVSISEGKLLVIRSRD